MSGPILVFDGGCPFCRYFAEISELKSGIKALEIRDGREDKSLREKLASKGFNLKDGAMIIYEDNILHGADAIQWICSQMNTSDQLLKMLKSLMKNNQRSKYFYPFFLIARRIALMIKGLPLDPG